MTSDERELVAAGHTETGGARAARKAARRVAKDRERARRDAETARRRAELETQAATVNLPARGDPGAEAGRAWRRLRVQPHRATSDVLAVAYPFLAEEGLGSTGVLVGQDHWSGTAFCYDPWALYERGVMGNPNWLVAGDLYQGKSMLAKSLACRLIAFGRKVYVPGDPKGEWGAVAERVGGQVIRLGVGSPARLNPLDPGPRPAGVADDVWRTQVTKRRRQLMAALAETAAGRPLTALERFALDAALDVAVADSRLLVMPRVVEMLHRPTIITDGGPTAIELREDGRHVAAALGRLVTGDLAGIFDGPSTVAFDPSLPMVSLDLSGVGDDDALLGLLMACAGAWMESALADPAGGQRLVVYDEGWYLMKQRALLARMQAQWKLSRAWGLSNMLIVHRLSDMDAVGDHRSEARALARGLLADTGTKIIYQQPDQEAADSGRQLGLSSAEVAEISQLPQGHGLWRVGRRSFVVHHLVTPAEKAMFNTDDRMVSAR